MSTTTAEERIVKLEAQIKSLTETLKSMTDEIEQLKKELAEEKAKNSKLEEENKSLWEENKSLKEQVKEWQVKWEDEHKLVIKLTEENEALKTRIVELENQLNTVHKNNPGFNMDVVAEIYKLQDQIRELTNKLETTDKKVEETNQKVEKLDTRERKTDEKLLEKVADLEKSKTEPIVEATKTDESSIPIVKKENPIDTKQVEAKTEVPELPKDTVLADGSTVSAKKGPFNWKGFYDSLDD